MFSFVINWTTFGGSIPTTFRSGILGPSPKGLCSMYCCRLVESPPQENNYASVKGGLGSSVVAPAEVLMLDPSKLSRTRINVMIMPCSSLSTCPLRSTSSCLLVTHMNAKFDKV